MIKRKVLQEFYLARASRDVEKHLSIVHEDCVFRVVGTEELQPLTRRYQGMSDLRATAETLFSTWDMRDVEQVSIDQCGDTVYVHHRGDVIYRPDGTVLPTEYMDKLTFRGGAMVEYLQFVDTFAIAKLLASKGPQDA